MCGVVGFISESRNTILIDNFVKDIQHRGPDSKNHLIVEVDKKYLHIGSARLAIRGDSKENMPMESVSKNILAYNGEVFDMDTLKKTLNNNINYPSDTRLLLDLFSHNIENVKKVNGMFAFAFYDNSKKKVYLGRDLLGIKPLYYVTKKNGDVFFSSEISSLIKNSGGEYSLEQDNLIDIFLFNGLKSNRDFIKGIKTVQPGEIISFDLNNSNNIETFKIDSFNETYTEIDRFEDLMEIVVQDHLNADTSVDLFLSGGIDSSILAYFIKTKLEKDVRHFSMTFSNRSFDESTTIKKISSTLGLESKIFTFDDNLIDQYVSESINNMGSLVLDYSFVPTYLLSKHTSQYTKAVLSGDGADEVFGGYEWYRGILYHQFLPFSIQKIIYKIIKNINITNKNVKYLSFTTKLKYFYKYLVNDPYVQMLIWQSSYQNFSDDSVNIIAKEINHYVKDLDKKINSYREIDLNYFLKTNVLPKVDIASMAHGLEVRPPYLDYRIINFAKNNPESNAVNLKDTKLFLRKYLENTELSFLNSLKKQGFGFPLSKWMNEYGLEYINQMYVDNNLVFLEKDKMHLNSLLSKNNLTPNDERELWGYYVLSEWCKNNKINFG
jgi:asparagine synthase (glutamine-hydrolysing)